MGDFVAVLRLAAGFVLALLADLAPDFAPDFTPDFAADFAVALALPGCLEAEGFRRAGRAGESFSGRSLSAMMIAFFGGGDRAQVQRIESSKRVQSTGGRI
ncbi:hypothetical protein [Marinicauda algicola]|uniref:hypothetical protein n=1 Tax=Marinicauda algicola TaxID=2029849 RepID=UPI0019D14BD9|nr:hypothetical protein [Marinicauda algicola]